MSNWQVTYFNVGTQQRHALIDNIDEATADAVVERFGPNGDEFHQMPDVRKEPMPAAA